MSSERFRQWARENGHAIELADVERVGEAWRREWPEAARVYSTAMRDLHGQRIPIGTRTTHERAAARADRLAHVVLLALAVVLGWLLVGCAQPIPINVRDAGTGESSMDELPEVVHEACAVLGLVCEASDRVYGSVSLDLIPFFSGDVAGVSRDAVCQPIVWAEPEVHKLAHELGHVFEADAVVGADGEGHLDLPDNVMSHDGGGLELLPSQEDAIADAADLFVNCR